eukprot:TRINITY_DN4054_c0_g1_i4.p1 TRINITY_DN4054_c0_g1~~TRINITY_DN4054_c0_g1_i4.p1  ORF type:complete len:226 (+),score=63.58 TRINITY_DN4054_c0_g1_i4:61-738(+)
MDQPGTHMQTQKSMHPKDMTPAKELTEEEQLVLRECQKESTMYRAFPLAAFSGWATYFGINNMGLMKPHHTYGASPKIVVAVALGYIIGKMSYFGTCQNKILEDVPHSNLAAAVRRVRGMPVLPPPDGSPQPTTHIESAPPNTAPYTDEYEAPTEPPPPQQSVRSYDDRRLLNRKMYEAHHGMVSAPVRIPSSAPPQEQSPISMLPPAPPAAKPSTNKYGDEGFE